MNRLSVVQGWDPRRKGPPALGVAVELANGSGVVIVSALGLPDNAVIYDDDGSERVRLVNPERKSDQLGFSEVFYELGELKLVLRNRNGQTDCVFDEQGALLRQYESR